MTQYVRAINIANNSIKSFVFDTNTSNTLNTAAVASAVAISANVSAQAVNTFVTLQTLQVANTPPSINTISITDSSYNILDDTAANTGGAYLTITGTNFQSGAIVMVGSSNTALSTTFVDSNNLRAQIPAIAAGTYPVYVVNTNGGTAIRINGLTTSPFPAWSTGATLTGQTSSTAFAINISATSDSNISYSNTSTLPTGTILLANGYFYGTVTVGSQTTYTFDVKATDTQNQDATRTFSVTVTPPPQYKLYTWGNNTNGSLGLNDRVNRSSPVQVGTDTNWSFVASGSSGAAAIKADGTLWTWGESNWGQSGQNSSIVRSSPVQVGSDTNWSSVVAGQGGLVILAIKTNGTLWAWGYNNLGSLGTNDIIARSSPTQIGTGTNWSKIGSYSGFSAAIKTDGTLWSWGQNGFGNLGVGDSIYRSSPTQVGSATNWSKLTTGPSRGGFLAIRSNGTLWGSGNASTIGAPGTNTMSQIGALTNWSLVTGLRYASIAVKNDGTLWAWGYNDIGQLGRNGSINTNNSSPVQIGSNTNWSNVFGGWENCFAIKTDGTLWSWGDNNNGQLGQNDRIYRSSPIQVGTSTSWTANTYCGENAVSFIQQA